MIFFKANEQIFQRTSGAVGFVLQLLNGTLKLDIKETSLSLQKPALKKALIVVLQWCFSHNFSVRLYALIALKKIWGMCRMLHVEEFEALTPVIESSLQQVENMHGTGLVTFFTA